MHNGGQNSAKQNSSLVVDPKGERITMTIYMRGLTTMRYLGGIKPTVTSARGYLHGA